jgi:hypothetical protein
MGMSIYFSLPFEEARGCSVRSALRSAFGVILVGAKLDLHSRYYTFVLVHSGAS